VFPFLDFEIKMKIIFSVVAIIAFKALAAQADSGTVSYPGFDLP
jgi:hypothetical protein